MSNQHKPECVSGNEGPEWSGSPNYGGDPDSEWICDECGAVIKPDDPIISGFETAPITL